MGYNYRAITRSTKIANRPAWNVGGTGQGIGRTPSAKRAVQIRAYGSPSSRNKIFYINQLGGVGRGRSMFLSNAGGINRR